MIVVTGAAGQLGTALRSYLPEKKTLFFDSPALDVTNSALLQARIEEIRPSYLINCAAYTHVDRAEQEPERAEQVNALALKTIGQLSKELSFHVIHFSTDYVFDGSKTEPYLEDDKPSPLGVYGKCKLLGERLLLQNTDSATVIRTSWVYAKEGKNFLRTMIRLSETHPKLRVVFDQIGTPTFAGDLARTVVEILPHLSSNTPKVFHYANEGVSSWYDFATAIFELSGVNIPVEPIRGFEYPTPAKRPPYSVLDKSLIKKTFGIEIPHWREGLKRCLKSF